MKAENYLEESEIGVFQFGPVFQRQKNGTLRVFVHPYASDGFYESQHGYSIARDMIIRKEGNPVIMLVGKKDLASVRRRYRRPVFRDYRAVIVTENSSPNPVSKSWQEVKDIIRKEFEPSKLLISGAELFLDENEEVSEYLGCVNCTYNSLKELNPKLEIESCFIVKTESVDSFEI